MNWEILKLITKKKGVSKTTNQAQTKMELKRNNLIDRLIISLLG